MAFLTTGAVAAQLQQQLLSNRDVVLINSLQQNGVAASNAVFSSLDVQQVNSLQVEKGHLTHLTPATGTIAVSTL